MPVIQGRTRKEIRQSIGYNLGAMHIGTATGTNNSTTNIVDASLTTVIGGNDDHVGKWIVFTSGSNDGDIARVTDYVASSTTLTFVAGAGVAVGTNTASGDTYELWDSDFPPTRIHDFINQAIMDVTGHAYDPVEDVSLHTDGHVLRFDAPSSISMIQDIYYRDSVEFTRLHACGDTFDTNTVSYFGVEQDSEDKKQGNNSLKFTLNKDGDLSAGTFLYDTITSKDISKYDYIEFWVKCSTATSASNLKLHLDNGAITGTDDLESINIPALTADTWTFVRSKLSNPELDTAIVSVGLEQESDLNSSTKYFVWLDDISVVRNDSAHWTKVPRNIWKADRQENDIIFDDYLDGLAPYALLKIVGGDKPALLSADSTPNEIDDSYVIERATGLAFSASSGGPSNDPDARRQQAAFWLGLSQASKRKFPILTNVRTVT